MQYFIIKSRGVSHGFLLFQGILLSSDLISLPASESMLEASETPSSSIFVVRVVDVVEEVVDVVLDVVEVVVFGTLSFAPQAAKSRDNAIVAPMAAIYNFFIFITPFYHFSLAFCFNTSSERNFFQKAEKTA